MRIDKEASTALRELETVYEENGKRYYTKWKQSEDDECTDIQTACLSDVPTKYLHRELAHREGVSEEIILHNERATVVGIGDDYRKLIVDGPASLLVRVY